MMPNDTEAMTHAGEPTLSELVEGLRADLERAEAEYEHLAAPNGTVAVKIDDLRAVLECIPDWSPIETAPTGDSDDILVAWPHRQFTGGYAVEGWCGSRLAEHKKAIAGGAKERAPHLYYEPTHWLYIEALTATLKANGL